MQIKKKTLSIIVIIILILGLGYFAYYKYLPTYKRSIEIQAYKKSLYESVVCEYSCPLSEQVYKNKTQMLPNNECIKSCTEEFKANYGSTSPTDKEKALDGFFDDLSLVISACKKLSTGENSTEIDNTRFFECASTQLGNMDEKYGYLN